MGVPCLSPTVACDRSLFVGWTGQEYRIVDVSILFAKELFCFLSRDLVRESCLGWPLDNIEAR